MAEEAAQRLLNENPSLQTEAAAAAGAVVSDIYMARTDEAPAPAPAAEGEDEDLEAELRRLIFSDLEK